MSRYRRTMGRDSSLLGPYWGHLEQKVRTDLFLYCRVMIKHNLTTDDVVNAVLDAGDRRILEQATKLSAYEPYFAGESIPLPSPVTANNGKICMLSMDYKKLGITPPKASIMHWQGPKQAEIFELAEQYWRVVKKFSTMLSVFEWMNHHGTAGAVRHYVPGMLNYIPEKANERFAVPVSSRYKEPAGVNKRLDLIREVGSLAAECLFLRQQPSTEPKSSHTLDFGSQTLTIPTVDPDFSHTLNTMSIDIPLW